MKLFLDSANLDDIRDCVEAGVISGVTINQSLLAKEPKRPYLDHLREIASIISGDGALDKIIDLSAPVTEVDPKRAVIQAMEMREIMNVANPEGESAFFPKVAVSWDNLPIIMQLTKECFSVNATCIFSGQQAMLAANAGAEILSVFVGRINDVQKDIGWATIQKAKLFGTVLAGSIRDTAAVAMALHHGADIVTTSKKVIMEMAHVEGSIKSAEKFQQDWEEWTRP